MMNITKIDHIVMTVSNIEATCAFYTKVLGFEVRHFKKDRKALHFGHQKINLHLYHKEFKPHANMPTPGSLDLCFISNSDINTILSHIIAQGVVIEEGPVERTGAMGPINSIYIRDPDLNLIEIATY